MRAVTWSLVAASAIAAAAVAATFAASSDTAGAAAECRVAYSWSYHPAASLTIGWNTPADSGQGVAEIEAIDTSEPGASASPAGGATTATTRPPSATVASLPRRWTSRTEPLSDASGARQMLRHEIDFTGLQPDTRYRFRCGAGAVFGPWQTFRTLGIAETFLPQSIPDRVILTWAGDPATSMAVSWRTTTAIDASIAEIAVAASTSLQSGGSAEPYSHPDARRVEGTPATTHTDPFTGVTAHYHSVQFTGLTPKTLYAYRVGDGERWSEWFQFRTASATPEPFSFLYFGDIQNGIRTMVSRVKRQALSHPDIRFKLYAGDLVNVPNDIAWGEWFSTDGWHNGMVPSLPSPGNHEFIENGPYRGYRALTGYWRHLFTLPDHGPQGFEESVYYLDYQGVRFISLSSTALVYVPETRARQLAWLEQVLKDNPNRWTCVFFHHPVWGGEPWLFDEKRTLLGGEAYLATALKPILDRYKVDLVMQGHVHFYTRGQRVKVKTPTTAFDERTGTLYMTTSSTAAARTPREEGEWMDKAAGPLQLYEVVTIDGDTLRVRTHTATGALFDAFDLKKQDGGRPNIVIDVEPATDSRPARSTPAATGRF